MSSLAWSRALFGTTLAFHIVFATLGVGLPGLIALAEIRAARGGDGFYRLMARRWAGAFAVFLGAGVVSGTAVALQLILLWPGFMRLAGEIIALPFAIEVVAFFIEAIFTAIYIHAGDRLPPSLRIGSAVIVALGAAASALLITDVNAFMNTPAGFRETGPGRILAVHPLRAMLNPAMPSELSHVLASAYLAVALAVAAFSAAALLRQRGAGARRDTRLRAYRLRELDLSMSVAAVAAVLTGVTGDWAGKFLAREQPLKFAALEGLFRTSANAALTVGGWPSAGALRTRFAVDIPGLLSWLATGRLHGTVLGLLAFPRSDWPPLWVHPLFDAMVGIGLLSAAAAGWYVWTRLRRRPPAAPLLTVLVALGPLAFAGVETGWIGAEVARQPWTVTGVLTTAQAATPTPHAGLLFAPFVALYAVLTAGAAAAVRGHLRRHPLRADLPAPAPHAPPHRPRRVLPSRRPRRAKVRLP